MFDPIIFDILIFIFGGGLGSGVIFFVQKHRLLKPNTDVEALILELEEAAKDRKITAKELKSIAKRARALRNS